MIIEINNRKIGKDFPPYIIAEMSANHNGDINRAMQIISMAKTEGADAIKIQTYHADTMTIKSEKKDFLIKDGLWKGYQLYDLYKEAETPYEWHKTLFDHAANEGITCFSSPFDETAVDLLEDLNCPAYKIASFEATDLPLIKYVAQTKKPIIASTGMLNLEEIEELVQTVIETGSKELILLHCVSSYPSLIESSNLITIKDIEDRFKLLVGLSDHTLGINVSLASIAMGACVIEKHVTLSRSDPGPDSTFSLEPNELSQLKEASIDIWKSIGNINYDLKGQEQQNITFRRSIYAVENIKAGEMISKMNVRRIRPGFGLPPKYYEAVLGKKAKYDIESGTPISWEILE